MTHALDRKPSYCWMQVADHDGDHVPHAYHDRGLYHGRRVSPSISRSGKDDDEAQHLSDLLFIHALLRPVRQVTLTERTTSYSTLMATDMSTTTLFFDRTLTSTVTVDGTCPPSKYENGPAETILMGDDDELLRNLLLSPTGIETFVAKLFIYDYVSLEDR